MVQHYDIARIQESNLLLPFSDEATDWEIASLTARHKIATAKVWAAKKALSLVTDAARTSPDVTFYELNLAQKQLSRARLEVRIERERAKRLTREVAFLRSMIKSPKAKSVSMTEDMHITDLQQQLLEALKL